MNDISQEISYDVVREQCRLRKFKLKLCTTVNSVNITCLKQTVDNKIQWITICFAYRGHASKPYSNAGKHAYTGK